MKHTKQPPTQYADLDELVFRARNKTYGSYELRKRYQRYTLTALLLAASAMTLAALSPKIIEALTPKEDVEQTAKRKVAYADLAEPPPINNETPPPPPPTQALPPPPQRAAVRFVPPEVVEDDQADPEVEFVDQDTLLNTNLKIDTENSEGDPFASIDGLEDGEGVADAPAEIQEPVDKEPDINAFVHVEKQPQPVNMDQFNKAIGYPPIAKEAGIEGVVTVRILVDKFGNYEKHVVLRNPHPALTKAVEDNISMLKFTPGIQAGKPIRVWVNVPVRFKLNK